MIIKFENTSENSQGLIEYENVRGQTVKSYHISELNKWVEDNKMNISYIHDAVGGTGMVCDPNTDFEEFEVQEDLTEYIDKNWLSLVKDFYAYKNPAEYVANSTPQQTRKGV